MDQCAGPQERQGLFGRVAGWQVDGCKGNEVRDGGRAVVDAMQSLAKSEMAKEGCEIHQVHQGWRSGREYFGIEEAGRGKFDPVASGKMHGGTY